MSSLLTNTKTPEPQKVETATKVNAPSLRGIPPDLGAARWVLEEYSGIAPEDVDAHILSIRDRAWSIFPYGCIASFSFLHPATPATTLENTLFKTIAARLKTPGSTETFLDVGCCLGSFIRHLIAEGIPAGRLYGTDLHPGFLKLGYELFRDHDIEATFVAGNILSDEEREMEELEGKIDIIHATAFFHLFEREGQLKAARRMVKFLRPGNPRAMILGTNGGPKIQGWEKYVLDAKGWQGLWDEVGEMTGTRWKASMDWEESESTIGAKFAVSIL